MSEIIINEKTHIELPVYLSIEHNILRNREYKRCFEYIEELINRNVKFPFNLYHYSMGVNSFFNLHFQV